jgi:hypothetical protein
MAFGRRFILKRLDTYPGVVKIPRGIRVYRWGWMLQWKWR